MAKELKVSVGTVRKPFDVLSGQGLVTRHRGRGTLVARTTDERAFRSFFRLVSRGSDARHLPTDTTLSREQVNADPDQRLALRLAKNDFVYRLRRRRVLNGKSLVLETISFPFPRVAGKEWGVDSATCHLVYSFLEQQCGVTISRVEDRLQTCLLNEDLASDFGLAAGHPVLLAVRTAYDLHGNPVEFRRSWMCTDAHDYLSELLWAASTE